MEKMAGLPLCGGWLAPGLCACYLALLGCICSQPATNSLLKFAANLRVHHTSVHFEHRGALAPGSD